MKNENLVRRRSKRIERLCLGPYSAWAVLFIVVPLIFVAYYAFTDNNFHFTTANITRFFTATSKVTDDSGAAKEVHTYLLIFGRSLKLAVISTILCLLMGYPAAYIISRSSARTQKIMITLIMIPMWMNFLIRTYAWMTILQDTGIFNSFLSLLHLRPIHIIGTESAVVIGAGSGLQRLRRAAPGHLAAEPAGRHLRHQHGADPLHLHLLHLPEAR